MNSIYDIKIKIVGSRLIGDKGYNSKQLKEQLKEKNVNLIYPLKRIKQVFYRKLIIWTLKTGVG